MTHMHRYAILVAASGDRTGYASASVRLDIALDGWSRVLDTPRARAWVYRRAPSALGHRPLRSHGVLIGRDFNTSVTAFDQLLTDTWGAYVAIDAEPDSRGVRVVRDPTGRIECWRLRLPGAEVLFSHYEDVHRLQVRPAPIDWDYLAHHLNQDYLHGDQTALTGITEVLPGEEVTYAPSGPTKRMRWTPRVFEERPFATLDAAQHAMREAGERVVSAWAGRYRRLTLDLSGGLDSSIVLGLLRRAGGHSGVIAVNRMTPGAEGDERAYARDAAALHGVELFEQIPEARDLDFSSRFSRRLMRPRARILPLGYDDAGIDLAHRFEAEAFFTGTGGDHLFYDHLQPAAIADYMRHRDLDGRGAVTAAVHLAQLSQSTVWHVAAEAWRQRKGGPPDLMALAAMPNPFLTAEARGAADVERFGHPWALAAALESPAGKLRQILNILELQRHYYRYGRADVAEETHALFSQPLLEACLRTPAHWFGVGGIQRGLARRAFADLLPDSIRARRSKGSNNIYWIEFLERRLPKIRELLLEGRLAERGLLDRRVMAEALTPLGLASGRHFAPLSVALPAELWVRQAEADRAEGIASATIHEPAE